MSLAVATAASMEISIGVWAVTNDSLVLDTHDAYRRFHICLLLHIRSSLWVATLKIIEKFTLKLLNHYLASIVDIHTGSCRLAIKLATIHREP